MSDKTNFTEWYEDNKSFLETNNVSLEVAEIIWNSAKTSAIHALLGMIQEGAIKVYL